MDKGSGYGGLRKLPYVLTEYGIAMISAVLRSDIAIEERQILCPNIK